MSTASSSDQLPPLPKIFYLHIPKTGGQTLATRLASAYPMGTSDFMAGGLYYPEGCDTLRQLFQNKQFVERHVTGPVLGDFFDADLLCTIREPIAQIVSNYLHVRRAPENWLHRVTTALSPRDFFAQFGDFLANAQSRYLTCAMFEQVVDPTPLKTLTRQMFDAIDRIRWIIPTESIDEFVPLWSIEMRRSMRSVETNINVARKNEQYERLIELVRGVPNLYSVDLLLWQAAKERFSEYRAHVARSAIGFQPQDDATRAFWDGRSGVWLRDGWYPPQIGTPVGTAWWAGPSQYSEVTYCRLPANRYLQFAVAVVHGVDPSRIVAVGPDKATRLPMVARMEAGRWNFWVDLAATPGVGSVWLWVPEVWAAIMVGGTEDDTDRRSFATCDWKFVDHAPVGDDVVVLSAP